MRNVIFSIYVDIDDKHLETLEGYRGMDPSIEDQIDIEIKAKSDLIALYKKIRDGQWKSQKDKLEKLSEKRRLDS